MRTNPGLGPEASTIIGGVDMLASSGGPPLLLRRKLKLKAKSESSLPYFSFKRLVPGAFNLGLIGSTCTALRCWKQR